MPNLNPRCSNDFFLYCTDTSLNAPHTKAATYTLKHGVNIIDIPKHARCPLDAQACGFSVSWTEVCQRVSPVHAAGTTS